MRYVMVGRSTELIAILMAGANCQTMKFKTRSFLEQYLTRMAGAGFQIMKYARMGKFIVPFTILMAGALYRFTSLGKQLKRVPHRERSMQAALSAPYNQNLC
ncbi:MAG: hypothetical protein AAGU11_19970 [Syntrophobacteraceae bacterium]